jgi:hypothetical protein
MSLAPAGLKSPTVNTIALVLLAIVLWGSWKFLRPNGGGNQVPTSPTSTTEELDDTTFRAAWQI